MPKKKKTVRRAKKPVKKARAKKPARKKKTTRRTKRKTAKKPVRKASGRYEEHHSVLREALKDIARELNQLREAKADVEGTLDEVVGDITSTQNKEVQLKDQLRKLSSVENSLTLKRGRMRKKLENVKTRISKVRQLSNQMENI